MKLSSSLEEYLKTIYILENTEKQVRITDIAKKLGISKPSVNRAVNTLKELQLINYESYGDIVLTLAGSKEAQDILKRYSTLKIFLEEILEVPKEVAKEEAKAMKHAISEETAKKLETYIENILNLGELDCNYDENSTKCKNCVKITVKNRMRKKKEEKKC